MWRLPGWCASPMVPAPALRCWALWLSLLPGTALACHEAADRGFGPIMIRSESPAQSLRLTPMPRDPNLLCAGEHELRVMYNVVSIWARQLEEPTYLLDFQMADTRVALTGGINDEWAYDLSYNDRRMVKVGLDEITFAFHGLFGIDNAGHDQVPHDDIHISVPSYGVDVTDKNTPLYSRSFELTLSRRLSQHHGGMPTAAASITVRKSLNSASPFENGEIDRGVELHLAWPSRENFLYANFAYTWFGAENFLNIPMRNEQFVGMLAYEWRIRPERSFITQYMYSQGVVRGLPGLTDPSHEVYFGYKWRTHSGTSVELGLIENIIRDDNSPDFGFAFGLVHPF